ncbi:MAG: hypothetical protein M3N41_00750 [Acidobacteriota bacterium]|nr:hypothetical protein [Acidobacteriota bacterium]
MIVSNVAAFSTQDRTLASVAEAWGIEGVVDEGAAPGKWIAGAAFCLPGGGHFGSQTVSHRIKKKWRPQSEQR